MKPTKKRPARRGDNPVIDKSSAKVIDKLMKLKYCMNDWYKTYGEDTSADKRWVMGQLSALREGARLDGHQMRAANNLWKKYAGH